MDLKSTFLKTEITSRQLFNEVSDIFSLLSDPTRLKIFWLLCHSKECVINIAQNLNMTMPAVSHHLKLLKEAKLIESYRDGQEVFYAAVKNERNSILHEMTEKLMKMSCPDFELAHEKINENTKYLENQIEIIKKVHDKLTENLSTRTTIEELSKEFGMNPTTMKTVFKDIYGTSVAAHIKEHRMEKAAQLLKETKLSVGEISAQVGYESQSKFSATFREFFNKTPAEYRNS